MRTWKHIRSFFASSRVRWGLALAVLGLWLFCLPKPLFDTPTATVVESREGMMVGARIASDGQWRFPQMDSVPNKFKQCILQFEDAYFYNHPGFNPVSMSKALWQNLTSDRRRGGSTLTQQVIRLSRQGKKRSYSEKFVEVFMATRLEAGYSKEEILTLYASHAPFGGNVVGLETASWRYFGIPSDQLSWGQAAALAVLPNAPSLIFPGTNEIQFKNKRDRLLKKLYEQEIIDQSTYELSVDEPLPGKPMPLPEMAMHLTEKLKAQFPGQRIQSSIQYHLQQQINGIAGDHHISLSQNQIHNLAVLVLDVHTREVLAYVGNSPDLNSHQFAVDIIDKPRSTGSILKPLLFAAALDSGELLPNTLVADVPTVVNGYSPKNFDNTFQGAVPASVALSRSLNVPAVRMLRSFGLQRFHTLLGKMEVNAINRPAHHYGLSLILGGAESSLWEITSTYANMASTLNFFNDSSSEYRSAEFVTPTLVKDQLPSFGKTQSKAPVLNAGAIYHTFKSLQEVNRPSGEENWSFFSDAQPIAWKTGTSFGFKDAWAVGVTPDYAIGVWVGNADGEGRPGLTGVQAAAPLLFDVLHILPSSPVFDIPYDELIEASVCSQSGHLAGVHCSHATTEWIPRKGIRTESCPYHSQIFLTESGQAQVNSSCYELAAMQQKSWFSLPPIMEYYYAPLHPEYRTAPPFLASCLQEGDLPMQLIFPKKNESIILGKDFEGQRNEVIFKLAHKDPETTAYWYLDDTFMGATETFHELAIAPSPGSYMLTVVDQQGNEVKQQVEFSQTGS